METASPCRQVEELAGSAAAFTSLLHEVLETQLLNEIAGGQITFTQFKVLALVDHEAVWSVGSVAACLRISDAAASKIVDRLVRHRLLRRVEAQDDRRVAEISLTERGRQLLHNYYTGRSRKLAQLKAHLSLEDLDQHADFLDRLSIEIRKQGARRDEICLHCGIYTREHCLLREQAPELCFFAQHATPRRAKGRDRHGDSHSQP